MKKVPSAAATLTFSSAEEHKDYNAMDLDSSASSSTILAHPHNRQRCWGVCKNQVRCHKVGDIMIEIQGSNGSVFNYFCSDDHASLEGATPDVLDNPTRVYNPEASLQPL